MICPSFTGHFLSRGASVAIRDFCIAVGQLPGPESRLSSLSLGLRLPQRDMLGVAILIGLARGIVLVMTDGMITDTLLQWMALVRNDPCRRDAWLCPDALAACEGRNTRQHHA